jgi:biotin operon repressor
MTSRLRTRTHDFYAPGEYNPRHDPDFRTKVFRLIATGNGQHIARTLGVDPGTVNDAVDALRHSPHLVEIEGDRRSGYQIKAVKPWRRDSWTPRPGAGQMRLEDDTT